MKYSLPLLATVLGASAYPFVMDHVYMKREERSVEHMKRQGLTPQQISAAETNCGTRPCLVFNAEDQYVSTSGDHAFQAPQGADIRGPCPGLNAAANHGYLNRNGVLTIQNTAQGLEEAYNFAPDFAAALAVFSSIISGDIVTEQWSIGGPLPGYTNVGGLLSPPQGISYSHNKYEGDVSIGRNDAYLNNGDAHSLNVTRFMAAYDSCTNDRCTLDKFRQVFRQNVYFSIENNPYYFSPVLAGAVVPPAAYNFVINFMSNHTEQDIGGYLDKKMFAEFFSVTGEYPNMKWVPGHEKIPDNWYKRPTSNQYGAVDLVNDDVVGWAAYPDSFRLGGNTNGVNTYKGVDVSLLTGGTYNDTSILEGNALGCLAFQSEQIALPDELKGSINAAQAALSLFDQYFQPIIDELGCPPLAKYDGSLFEHYPGYSYNPTAPKK